MRTFLSAIVAVSVAACVSLPREAPVASGPTDAVLLEGEWSGEFNSEDGRRGGGIAFALDVKNDTAVGRAVLRPVVYLAAEAGASVPSRTETRPELRMPMYFVSTAESVVTGVMPAYFDVERMGVVQTTFVGQMRSWNVIEGTYFTLGPNLRIEERGTWRVVRGTE